MNKRYDVLPSQLVDTAEKSARMHGQEVVTHYQTPTVGVVIPVIQAAVTGVALGIAFGIIAWAVGTGKPLKIAIVTWAIVQALAWLYLLMVWFNRIGLLEQLLKMDLNHDGYIGNNNDNVSGTIKLVATSSNGRAAQIGHLPGTKGQLVELARGLAAGSPFSRDAWSYLYKRGDFYALQSVFVRRGWAKWKDESTHTLGVELTDAGEDCIEKIARGEFEFEEDTTPLPRAR